MRSLNSKSLDDVPGPSSSSWQVWLHILRLGQQLQQHRTIHKHLQCRYAKLICHWIVLGCISVFFRLCPETSRDFRQRVGHMLHQKLFFLKVALPAIEGKVITGCTFWEQKNFRSPAVRSAAAEDVFFSELKQW